MGKSSQKKDSFYAKIAFYLSLGFWIPLFNVGICAVAMTLAIMALRKHFKDPAHYGGVIYAAISLILSITSIVLTIIGLIIFLMGDQVCGSAICQNYVP